MDLVQYYNLGFIVDAAGKRLETKLTDINYITKFFFNVNFIKNIQPTYVEVNFATDTDAQIYSKLQSDTVNIWITCVENSKVLRLWQSFFKYEPVNLDDTAPFYPENENKLLISVCDDILDLLPYRNILHINNTSIALLRQFEKVIWNRISVFSGQTYTTLYIFYSNQYQSYANNLLTLFQQDDVQQLKTYLLCNTSNNVEYSQTITKIQADVLSGKLTYDNTMFIYLENTYNVYFQIFSIVEDPVQLGDPDIQNNPRHNLWYESYINMGYLNAKALMKQNLVPKFLPIDATDVEYSNFFRTKTRAFVPAQALTKYQNDRLNYLNYVFYVRTPVSELFLETNRITIYTALLEKAITLAKEILYRDLPTLSQFYQNSIYTDGRTFGPINYDLTGYANDDSYFNQIVLLTYPLGELYYVTLTTLEKKLREATLIASAKRGVAYIPGLF